MASFPSSIKTFATLVDLADSVLAAHQNERGDEITAIETALKSFTSFTPSWTNLTVGNGTVDARYTNDGGWISGYIMLTWGSTTSISGSVAVSLPAAMHSMILANSPLGDVTLVDTGSAWYVGRAVMTTSSQITIRVMNASATYTSLSSLSSTVPFTWTTGDFILITFRYKAA